MDSRLRHSGRTAGRTVRVFVAAPVEPAPHSVMKARSRILESGPPLPAYFGAGNSQKIERNLSISVNKTTSYNTKSMVSGLIRIGDFFAGEKPISLRTLSLSKRARRAAKTAYLCRPSVSGFGHLFWCSPAIIAALSRTQMMQNRNERSYLQILSRFLPKGLPKVPNCHFEGAV